MSQSLILLCLTLTITQALAGQFINFQFSGRTNRLFIPSTSYSNVPAPLFVMLHGCTQNPNDFSAGTQMNVVAEKYGFYVLYPLQPSSANTNKCWNWFERQHQTRGKGEPQLIATMAQAVMEQYSIDKENVYVAGLSAGAAMAVIVGATYPDVFACIGPAAGLEYQAATSVLNAYTAMSSGGPNPRTQGQVAYKEMNSGGKNARPLCVVVTQGTSDFTVNKVNGEQVSQQWSVTNDLSLCGGTECGEMPFTPTKSEKLQVPGGRSYTANYYEQKSTGKTWMIYLVIDGMGHAWSGGSTSGTYTDPKGPNASEIMAEFFLNSTVNPTPVTAPPTDVPTAPPPTAAPTIAPPSNEPPTIAPTEAPTPSGDELEFMSIGDEDGYVGMLEADGMSTLDCKVGDKGMFNVDTYRLILSFDTSKIPAGAEITGAKLSITKKSLSGTISSISIDMSDGGFSGSNKLSMSDYSASASSYNIASMPVPINNSQVSSVILPESSYKFINRQPGNRTQFRLKEEATASFTANLLSAYCGGTQNPPTLVVSYS